MQQFVEVAWDSLRKQGEELSGDSVKITTTPNCFLVVLSDGLGSGVKANILSTLTTQIAATMFQEGAAVEDVIDTLIDPIGAVQCESELGIAAHEHLKADCLVARGDQREPITAQVADVGGVVRPL